MNNHLKYKLNDITNIDAILLLSKGVFSPSKEDIPKYHDKDDWLSKIKNNGLLISVYDNEKCIAFAICYKVDISVLHIWNVGVQSKYRGRGIWREIYKRLVDYAIEKGYKKLTLNTYKEKFPNMYMFVKKEGFHLKKEEIKAHGYDKSYFVKDIV